MNKHASFVLNSVQRFEPDAAPTSVTLHLFADTEGLLHSTYSQDPLYLMMLPVTDKSKHVLKDLTLVTTSLEELTDDKICEVCAENYSLLMCITDVGLLEATSSMATLEKYNFAEMDAEKIELVSRSIETIEKLATNIVDMIRVFEGVSQEIAIPAHPRYRQILVNAVDEIMARLKAVCSKGLSHPGIQSALRRHATEILGVTANDDLVLVKAYGIDTGNWDDSDDAVGGDQASADHLSIMAYATTLQVAFAPETMFGTTVVPIPAWVAAALVRIAPDRIGDTQYHGLTTAELDTAVRLWTTDRDDVFNDVDACVASARKLINH